MSYGLFNYNVDGIGTCMMLTFDIDDQQISDNESSVKNDSYNKETKLTQQNLVQSQLVRQNTNSQHKFQNQQNNNNPQKFQNSYQSERFSTPVQQMQKFQYPEYGIQKNYPMYNQNGPMFSDIDSGDIRSNNSQKLSHTSGSKSQLSRKMKSPQLSLDRFSNKINSSSKFSTHSHHNNNTNNNMYYQNQQSQNYYSQNNFKPGITNHKRNQTNNIGNHMNSLYNSQNNFYNQNSNYQPVKNQNFQQQQKHSNQDIYNILDSMDPEQARHILQRYNQNHKK